eukprot:g551.t1
MKTCCEEAAACHSSAKSSASTCSPLTSSRTTSMQDLNWTARTSMPDSTKSSRPSLPDALSTNTTRVVGGACCLSSQEKDAGSDGAGGIGVDSQNDHKDTNRLKRSSSDVISRGPAAPATSSHTLAIEPPSGASTPGPPSPIGARIERASVERREVSHSTLAEELKLADGCPRFLGPFTVGVGERIDVDMDLPAETDEQSESARLSGLPRANAPVSCADHKKALTSKDENCPELEPRLH